MAAGKTIASSGGETENTIVKPEQNNIGKNMHLQYLEIVASDAEALCTQYSAIHGVTFGEPDPSLGNARTAKISGGSVIAIRGPLRETETPVIRPYIPVSYTHLTLPTTPYV